MKPDPSWTPAEFDDLPASSPSAVEWVVFLVHISGALSISTYVYMSAVGTWFTVLGVVVPILLGTLGIIFLLIPNENWNRNEMLPHISCRLKPREEEKERLLRYHRRLRTIVLPLSWLAIVLYQYLWTYTTMLIIRLAAVHHIFADLPIFVMIGTVILFLAMILGILTVSE